MPRSTGTARRSSGAVSVLLSSGAAIAVGLLLANGPAAATSSGLIWTGPWGKGLVTPADVLLNLAGCAAVHGSRSSTFDKRTGLVLWHASATTSGCAGRLGRAIPVNEAVDQRAASLTYPVRVPSGTNSVTFNVTWNLTAEANYSLTYSGHCPGAVYNATLHYGYSLCEAESISQVIATAELVDLTTGVIAYPSSSSGSPATAYSFVENESYCTSASSCTYSNVSASSPWTGQNSSLDVSYLITATTTSADHYAIYTYAGGDVAQLFQVYRGSATGSVNLGTGGHFARLLSIVES
jgi:hypothetical protein